VRTETNSAVLCDTEVLYCTVNFGLCDIGELSRMYRDKNNYDEIKFSAHDRR